MGHLRKTDNYRMLIPYTALPQETLDQLLGDYVTRDGTDNGTFTTQAERKAQLLSSLERDEAFITFNYEYQQACLIQRHEVDPVALREYEALKASVKEEAHAAQWEAEAEVQFKCLHARLTAEGVFPIHLGRTLMQREINILIQSGKVTLPQLQNLLHKHSEGDFGLVSWGDKLSNLRTIKAKGYLLSRYNVDGISLIIETLDGHPQTMVMDHR
jgi:uncharacterized protein YheU (UPF0270 family)